jgi:outer membrane protein TolC
MRDRARFVTTFVTVLVVAGTPLAAEPAVEKVGFDEAVRRAVENNYDVARAAAAILTAEALLDGARAVILPSVELFAAETVIDDQRGFENIVSQPKEQFSASATLEVPVLAASDWAAKAQAADQVEVARLAAADVRRQVASAAAQAYLAIVAAHRQVEVDERARDNAQAQYDYAKTRFDAGAGSKLDALRAADVLATSEVLVERSKLVVTLSQESLGVLLAADRPVDVAGEPALEIPEASEPLDLSLRTDLRLLERQQAAAQRVLDDSWKDWMPDVVATFDPLYIDPAGAFQESSTWRAVLAARFSLFLGGERAADRELRRTALEQTRIDLEETELRARAEVRSARAAVDSAKRAMVSARQAADDANDVLDITEQAFRAGARTNIELVDAQRRARDAETAVARAEDILRQAKLELLVALGLFGTDAPS